VTVIQDAASAICEARSIVITAGAGMGVDSGLPDFRGNKGFWDAYPALKGYPFEEMANPRWFKSEPRRAWGFYGHRLNLYRDTIPHEGFNILRQWTEEKDYFIFTSNVDGAFQKVGFSEQKIIECHGSIHYVQLLEADEDTEISSAKDIKIIVDKAEVLAAEPLPRRDGKILRPNILMFGDWSWLPERSMKQENRLGRWLNAIDSEKTVVIEMGAGTAIPSVRRFSEQLQFEGMTLIRINPRESEGPLGTISIADGAKKALQEIDALL
jgi:NAD-dependent SIR2 family protein deacetylase